MAPEEQPNEKHSSQLICKNRKPRIEAPRGRPQTPTNTHKQALANPSFGIVGSNGKAI
jgi:hypothetical protein